jgi:hypothetical protein
VHAAKPLGVLQRRRRRGHLRHGPQHRSRRVGALIGQVIEERAADQLALRQTHHHLPRRAATPTDLHRLGAPLPPQLAVDRRDQIKLLGEITDHHQPAMPGQPRIVGTNLDPSGTPGIVHPNAPSG